MKFSKIVAGVVPTVLFASAVALTAISVVRADDMPAVGQTAPGFTLNSQEGKPVSLSDYRGKWVVLYFYPKDMTQGCTIEAHNFQRDLAQYDKAKAVSKLVRDRFKKVKVQIQGDAVRVFSAKKDELQAAMQALRDEDFGIPLQFTNYR